MGENLYVRSMIGILDELYNGIKLSINEQNEKECKNGISSIATMVCCQDTVNAINIYRWHYDSFSKIISSVIKDELVSIRKTKEGKHYLLYGSDEEE